MTFVDAINVNNNEMVFFADDHALIKLLRQEKGYGAKRFIAKFSSKSWILSELNKLLRKIDTSHFGMTSHKNRCSYCLCCMI